MEIHFQHQKKLKATPAKMKARENNKFIGVRQRPSGRWVAEIKDTTQKIRMWLGTFETAQEAARAYDEAACLLRGPNTRTNFLTQVSHNSPLASRIRNLLNTKKTAKHQLSQQSSCPSSTSQDVDSGATSSCTTSPSTTVDTNTSSAESFSFDTSQDCTQLFDDVYKPDLSNCDVGSAAQSGGPWGFDHVPDRFSFAQELSDLPRNVILSENSDVELSEFERMKVERQISASLYAINGLHEYMESVYDPSEPLWDLPPLCSLLS